MFVPLNVPLYNALKRAFNDVGVMYPNVSMLEYGYRKESRAGGGEYEKLVIAHPGETYYVRCPFCHSTEKKLYINHTWAWNDGNRDRLWLAQCFRSYRCLDDHGSREALLNYLHLPSNALGGVVLRRGRRMTEESFEPWWPEGCEPVNDLLPGHPVARYLVDRGYSLDDLYEKFKVHYCFGSFSRLAKNRIIIPFFTNESFVGWQGRCPADLPWKHPDKEKRKGLPPKYTNMPLFPKSKHCYNLDSVDAGVIVVVEGVTGVWRHAEGVDLQYATAVQGMSPSSQQLRLLAAKSGREKPIVWLLDPGSKETEKAVAASSRLNAAGYPSFVAKLPAGRDPGDLDAGFQRSLISEQAAAAGIEIKWPAKERTRRAAAAVRSAGA